MTKITPLLLCGGSGTRLWPLSRKSFPKQFARLTGAGMAAQYWSDEGGAWVKKTEKAAR